MVVLSAALASLIKLSWTHTAAAAVAACRRVWHTGTGRCQSSLTDKANPALGAVRFTPNGSYVLTGGWWGNSGQQGHILAAPSRCALPPAWCCHCSLIGQLYVPLNASFLLSVSLSIATLDSRLLLWDPKDRKVKKTYVGHRNEHSCCQVSGCRRAGG